MEPEDSLPCSQEPSTGPYPEQKQSSAYHPILSNIHLNVVHTPMSRSRDSVVGPIEKSEFESRWGQEFSLLQIVQTGSEVHPTSSPMGTGGSFPGGKAAGA
jgi:hypothetical protein